MTIVSVRKYLKATQPFVVAFDVGHALLLAATPFIALLLLRTMAESDGFVAPLHRRLWAHPGL